MSSPGARGGLRAPLRRRLRVATIGSPPGSALRIARLLAGSQGQAARCPLLVQVCGEDVVTPPEPALEGGRGRTARASSPTTPGCKHFDDLPRRAVRAGDRRSARLPRRAPAPARAARCGCSRPRHAAELRQDGAGHRRRARALRARSQRRRAHRPALRPGDVGDLLRGARGAGARPHARGRLGLARRADRAGDRAARARCCAPSGPTSSSSRATSTRPSRRRSRAARARGSRSRHVESGPAQLRPHDARGDQPDRHRPPLRALLPALDRGRGQPRAPRASDASAGISSATR